MGFGVTPVDADTSGSSYQAPSTKHQFTSADKALLIHCASGTKALNIQSRTSTSLFLVLST